MKTINYIKSEQLLVNLRLDQYDQVSCTNGNEEVIASFGALRQNKSNEIYFDLSSDEKFDPFHPLKNQYDLHDKFFNAHHDSGRLINIHKLFKEKFANNPYVIIKNDYIEFTNQNTSYDQLLRHGIKGKEVDSSTIKLYLPIIIKDKHIENITKIINNLCT